ncbi:hypothetical protein GGTG_12261 [Gaeumannomyces tritici R3-111a-1]|uniref:Hsp70-like protein n=1 Tax=Gaeumannomyces tritici (strain R3-111a-1) TaxID=644352 RepID=J3PFI6_GAET3|nr:hypothetical protein GGTG_12261 [Gaeumannomyces tritici R3-111a-1]EJT70088.1 hypothetical protein GGTG_12261 [Gaeumannomyces tritici R3-111a-1]
MDFENLRIKDRKIIVGIDFGTTYSGVAWAETQRPDRRDPITTWPISRATREGESSEKVPTRLRYDGDEIQWGFSIPPSAPQREVLEWFKLDLDPALQSMGDAVTKDAASRSGRTTDELVADYLSALGDHLMYTLREKLGEDVIKNTPLEFVVTVPAIWSDLAKDKTRQACLKASGLQAVSKAPIHLVSEPEAAAMYALHGLDPHGLNVGDSFVICDAGGGTVDLITYTITKLKPILEVQEAAPGSGALCGSTFLNLRFSNFLKAKLGHLEGFDDELLSEAMDKFEKTVKRQFSITASPDDTFAIPVGGLANNRELGISRGRYSLKATDLQTIFEPVVLEVIKLVRQQMAASKVDVRAVLLVGGFGASNYLKGRLRNALLQTTSPAGGAQPIEVLQPANAWLAVVQGAVMKGLALSAPDQLTMVKVRNRRARKSYGTEWRSRYDETKHGNVADKRHWCGLDGCYKIYTMEWFMRTGDAVSENEPFCTRFIWTGAVSAGRIRKVRMEIYGDVGGGEFGREAPICRDDQVALVCHVEADLSHIPEDMLKRRTGSDGNEYYDLECKIEALYLSASTQYTLIYNNQRYNSVTAEYV